MPDDVTLNDVDDVMLTFVAETSNRKLLDDRLTQLHGCIDWNARAPGALVITCCVPLSKTSAQLKNTWPASVTQAARDVLASFQVHCIEVLQDCWKAFLSRVGRVEQSSDDLRVIVDHDACKITIVGKTSPFKVMVDKLGKVSI